MSGLQIRRRRRPELNLVPLIDVLVMLVFFAFVTMQFRSPGTLNITLPRVDTAGKNAFEGTVILGIGKEGELTFATDSSAPRRIVEKELEGLLEQIRNLNKDVPVLIRADETTPLKTLAFVMDSCRKAGLNKFSLQSR
ncbi:MAG: biopolymer transporter ExbD [Verrucomicrobia bacterium]|nr:biopolymer transporter ExbD [Verrucomicrobiota bacterium]